MLNPLWLNTFVTLIDTGHFTKTAEKLFMTQPGVSQHIKKLELHLDSALLIREGKSFSLTNAGEQLFQKGKELLRSSEELEQLIKLDEPYEGRVKISSPGSVGLKLYPFLLDLQQTHPKLAIDYAFAPNTQIEQDIADRKIDLGLLTQLNQMNSLVSKKIAVEPLVLVTSNKVASINWQALVKLGFISHPDAEHHGRFLLSKNFPEFEHIEQFEHKGFSNQISLILEPVSKNIGFTVLPLYAAKAFHKQSLINIHHLKNSVNENLYLCFNKNSIMTNRSKFIQTTITHYLK